VLQCICRLLGHLWAIEAMLGLKLPRAALLSFICRYACHQFECLEYQVLRANITQLMATSCVAILRVGCCQLAAGV
jgi:hypothetical protein